MKIGVENKKIYVETKDYDAFYGQPTPCKRFITVGEAIRLKDELNRAIQTLKFRLYDKI